MKSLNTFLGAALTVAVIGLGCGDDKGTSSATFPTGGANGPNLAVTSATAGAAFAEFSAAMGRVQGLGIAGLATKPLAAKPLKKVTVNGQNSGTATFDGSGSVSGTNITYNATITFNNFSDDGEQFYQGKVTWKYTLTGSVFTYEYKGTINTQGAYKATMEYDIEFSNSALSGSIKITSDGQTFTYNLTN